MGSGGLVVMDDKTCMVEVARFFMNFTQNESCGKCVPCREGTKRMLEILERIVDGKGEQFPIWMSWKNLQPWFQSMALCGLGKSAPLPVISTLKRFRDEYVEHSVDKKCRAKVCTALRQFHSILSSVSAAASVQRTVRLVRFQERSSIHMIINNDVCIKCGPVRITVTLMRFMWKHRREDILWVQ